MFLVQNAIAYRQQLSLESSMKSILVTGGAGYIGSHMCKALSKGRYTPVVLDSLECGHVEAVRWGPFVRGDVGDQKLVEHILSEYCILAVVHFAAFCYVGESVGLPGKYYENNVAKSISLLEAMRNVGVFKLVFSSSCATYGEPKLLPIDETHPQVPVSPYGRSKLMVETILRDFSSAYGFKNIALRYFNAAGADPGGELGEDHRPETHLIPLVRQTALGKRRSVDVYGHDYHTKDGTCIRDYVHVDDLAEAHLLALERLLSGDHGGEYNLGSGHGNTILEVIRSVEEISGRRVVAEYRGRRAGDPAVLVASGSKACDELGWKPRMSDMDSIIRTAWKWLVNNPNGF